MYSLRRNIQAAYLVVGIFLAVIIVLAINQYALSSRYTSLIEQSERTIFGFSTLREITTEYLLERDWEKLERIIPEIEELNSELARLQENPLIPPEYKLALVDKVDLKGIILSLKRISGGDDSLEQSKMLQAKMRVLAEHLLQFDRIIVSQARERILNFQMIIIGFMGLLISMATFALTRLERTTVVPLLELSTALREGQIPDTPKMGQGATREIVVLADAVRQLVQQGAPVSLVENQQESEELRLALHEMVNETMNGLNGIINYAQLLHDKGEERLKPDDKEVLAKIIQSGSAIADKWQKI